MPVPISTPTSSAEVDLRVGDLLLKGLGRGGHRELDEPIGPRASLGSIHRVGSKSTTSAANRVRKPPESNRSTWLATTCPKEVAPQGLDVVPERGDGAHSGDDDSGGIRRGWHTRP